jgi:hypothetical protein
MVACGSSSSSSSPSSSSGGGGGNQVSAAAWAGTICGALSTWGTVLSKQPAGLQSPSSATDINQIKTDLSTYLGSAVDATNNMISSIKSAGSPNVDNGSSIQSDLLNGLQPVAAAFSDAKAKVDAASIADPAAFQTELQGVATALTTAGDAAKASLTGVKSKYKTDAIDQAFNSTPACKSVGG